MPAPQDRELLLARFDGTNLLVDSAYLGPTYLRRSQNWIPGETFRLEKRPGATVHPGDATALAGVTRIHALFAVATPTNRYLYCVGANAGTDTLYVSTNDGAWAAVTSGTFTSDSEVYGFEVLHGIVYVSNGIDVPKRIDVASTPTTATDLTAIASFTDGSAAPTLTADSGAGMLTGTYAYSWCIFDHTVGIYLERGQTREITKSAAADQSISFPVPTGFATNGGALSSRYRAHLFVSPVNLPVEFAHDQTPEGLQSGSHVVRHVVADGPPVPLRGAVRRGQALRAYRGRLVLGVDTTTTQAVWCTDVLAPGREQAIFNAGEFFPHNGRLPRPPTNVTAIGLAATGERGGDAVQGPLVVTTLSQTFLFFGDILDDPSAAFVQVSARAGCVGPMAMTETPVGLFYIGTETVWCVPAGGGQPVDVGWPIRPAVKDVPPGSRSRVLAFYHKGFLKIHLVPQGGTTATQGWWLDLRQGLTRVPSWWGPHLGVAPSAVAVSQTETNEPDRAWHAVEGSNVIELIHQTGTAAENDGDDPIVSILEAGELHHGRPFDRKLWKRLRVIAFLSTDTSIAATITLDGVQAIALSPLLLDTGTADIWDIDWDVTWGQEQYVEGESVFPADRPRSRALDLRLTHAAAIPVALREIELLYEESQRTVRSVPNQHRS